MYNQCDLGPLELPSVGVMTKTNIQINEGRHSLFPTERNTSRRALQAGDRTNPAQAYVSKTYIHRIKFHSITKYNKKLIIIKKWQ